MGMRNLSELTILLIVDKANLPEEYVMRKHHLDIDDGKSLFLHRRSLMALSWMRVLTDRHVHRRLIILRKAGSIYLARLRGEHVN